MSETSMNIAFDEYKQKLGEMKPVLDHLGESMNLDGLRGELERLHAMQEAPDSGTTRRKATRSW